MFFADNNEPQHGLQLISYLIPVQFLKVWELKAQGDCRFEEARISLPGSNYYAMLKLFSYLTLTGTRKLAFLIYIIHCNYVTYCMTICKVQLA